MSRDVKSILRLAAEEAAAGRRCVVATVVRDTGSVPRAIGAKMLVYPDGRAIGSVGGGLFESLVARQAIDALRAGRSSTQSYSFNPTGSGPFAFGAVCGGRADVFLEVIMPADTLLIVGGGHCGQALARAASLLDFTIIVVDDREEFAQAESFAFDNVASVLHLPSDYEGLPEIDENTYIALVTKGFVTDEAALRRVLGSPAAYIGMIGSKRKRDLVYANLRADGVDEDALAAIHAPIGLQIGSDTPEEIAVSILAEVIQVRAAKRSLAPAENA